MTPFEPQSPNLFHALQFDPSFKGKTPPVLTAARLEKSTPAAAAVREQPRPLKNMTRTLHKIIPAVSTRLKCIKVGGAKDRASPPGTVLACVKIAFGDLDDAIIEVEKMDVLLEKGEAKLYPGMTLPRTCRMHDVLSFVYHLTPDDSALGPSASAIKEGAAKKHSLSLELNAKIQQPAMDWSEDDGAAGEERAIVTKWRTIVDFTPLSARLLGPAKAYPLTINVKSASAPVPTSEKLTWTVTLSNTTAPGRSIRAKVEPLLDHKGEPVDIIALKPYVTTPTLGPGSSATLSIDFKILRAGPLKTCPLRIVEIDENRQEVKDRSVIMPPEKLPTVIAAD